MQQLSSAESALLAGLDAAPMLGQVQAWSAINTGTGNLAGLAEQAGVLADAFAALPGEVRLAAPAPVTAVAADGQEVAREHGAHMVLSVRPEAQRGVLLPGNLLKCFPPNHPVRPQGCG